MITDKVCIVLGAAVGIGPQLIEDLVRNNNKVCVMDSCKARGKTLQKHIMDKHGVKIFFFHGDAADDEDVGLFCNAVIGQYGQIDAYINHVSIDLCGISEKKVIQKMDKTLSSGVLTPYVFLQHIKEYLSEDAVVINAIISNRGEDWMLPKNNTFIYFLIEKSTEFLTRYLEGAAHYYCLVPGLRDSKNKRGLAVGEEFGFLETVEFLCEKKGDFLSGSNILVDGSMKMIQATLTNEGRIFFQKRHK